MKRSKIEVLNADFAAARADLLNLAAFLDRVDRAEGTADFRLAALTASLPLLATDERTRAILEKLSYQGTEPEHIVAGKAACGAPNPQR